MIVGNEHTQATAARAGIAPTRERRREVAEKTASRRVANRGALGISLAAFEKNKHKWRSQHSRRPRVLGGTGLQEQLL